MARIFLKVSDALESLRGLAELNVSVYEVNSLGVFVGIFNHSFKKVGFMETLLAISSDNPILLR